MEVQSSESKKLFKVFDASKRKRAKKKLDGPEDINSVGTDDSNTACPVNAGRIMSVKASVHQVQAADTDDGHRNNSATRLHDVQRQFSKYFVNKSRGSNTAVGTEDHRSPRRHRRLTRDGLSLALKGGLDSSPRSVSPPTGVVVGSENPSQDHDSLIYAFLEEAIKRDKRKHRHERRQEERHRSRECYRERDESHDHRRRHRHHRHREDASKDRDKSRKESPSPDHNQAVLLETFAKICAQMNSISPVQRTHSHKSLQCEVASRREIHSSECRPERLASHEHTHGNNTPTRIRSQENCRKAKSRENVNYRPDKCPSRYDAPKIEYEKDSKYASRIDCGADKYPSKINETRSRAVVGTMNEDDRYRGYHPPENVATRTCIGSYRDRHRERDYRDVERRPYEDERRRYVEQKTSRSFDTNRDGYEEGCRRTSRSDTKDKRYDDRYYDKTIPEIPRHFPKDPKPRRPADRDKFDRNSVTSREEEYRDRDHYSERERDSGLSVADGESTVSGRTGRSNYMKAVKQEIAEQREAMDKMMKLWKELMRCFKGMSQDKDKAKSMNESACENVRENAAAQLRLWRECMRRYETVARDVGDTDARLMEEINKQRSEMSEMANMWQECLQRYRDMSNDFNTLKQQLATAESPTRLPPEPAPALVCAEGERAAPQPAPMYRMPHTYSQIPATPGPGYPCMGSPLRSRASAPPAWWWGAEHPPRHRSSRRSSPDSRDGRDTDRDRRHRNKDTRDVSRYKEKSSKPSAARSDHHRRKR